MIKFELLKIYLITLCKKSLHIKSLVVGVIF